MSLSQQSGKDFFFITAPRKVCFPFHTVHPLALLFIIQTNDRVFYQHEQEVSSFQARQENVCSRWNEGVLVEANSNSFQSSSGI